MYQVKAQLNFNRPQNQSSSQEWRIKNISWSKSLEEVLLVNLVTENSRETSGQQKYLIKHAVLSGRQNTN